MPVELHNRLAPCKRPAESIRCRAADVLNLLNEAKVTVAFADSPNASQLQIGILAVVAEEEARAISARTKAALAAAKARGTRLGNPDGAAVLARYRAAHGNRCAAEGARKSADEFARQIQAFIEPLVAAGLSDAAIADALNADGIQTRRGARWYETTVRRIRKRLAV
jgi:DNA invertase Pin-like site-specific DNA recombinase